MLVMAMLKSEEIKIRVPAAMKAALKQIADSRFTSESEIAREALLDYLAARGIGGQELREGTVPYKVNSLKPSSVVQAEDEIVDAILEEGKKVPVPKPVKPE